VNQDQDIGAGVSVEIDRDAMNNRILRDDIDVQTVLDCIVGAYLSERGRRGSVAPGWSGRALRTILPALKP
jgi:hypothetical protein